MTLTRSLSCLASFSFAAALVGCTVPPVAQNPCRVTNASQTSIAKSSNQAIQEAAKSGSFKRGGITSSINSPVGITVIRSSHDPACK